LTSIRIDGVARSFGSVAAVDNISLEIAEGEFCTLLGPSGCGKTTLLRMVAGFCELDRGTIAFDGRRVDGLPPHRRNTGMVFQSYAIFPNFTVAQNVAYGLKARRVGAAETVERVRRALELVQLERHAERWPHQLSGGQLQRVAIARCLVIEPAVLLLDEPLSNLDARLRVEMRAEIRALQKSLGLTAIYVTHDQDEALAMSDRIAVMRAGRIEQVDAPGIVYRRPRTAFVAAFMGTTNLLTGRSAIPAAPWMRVRVGAAEFLIDGKAAGDSVTFSLRPEALHLLEPGVTAPAGWATLAATLGQVEFLGAMTRLEAIADGGLVLQLATLDQPPDMLAPGQAVTLTYDPAAIVVFA
jgi:ABC-type Fe3+/spermidine/putrescine transport system ATPase subunit